VDHDKHASAGFDGEAALTSCAKSPIVKLSITVENAAGTLEMLINISSVVELRQALLSWRRSQERVSTHEGHGYCIH
jgi:hypothetical protein